MSSQAAFDRSSRLLVTWGGGPAALIYDVLTGSPTARLLHRGRITVARFAPTSNVLRPADWTGSPGSGMERPATSSVCSGAMSVAFSTWHSAIRRPGRNCKPRRDGTGVGSEVRHPCRDPPGSRRLRHRTRLQSGIGELIVTASRDRMARIFDADSGTLRATLAGHEEAVRDVAFGADPRTVATASTDGTIRLWDAQPFPVLELVDKVPSSAEAVAFGSAGAHRQRWPGIVRNRLFALSDDPRLAFPAQGFEALHAPGRSPSERARTVACSSPPIATARSESGGPTTSRTGSRYDARSSPIKVLGSATP